MFVHFEMNCLRLLNTWENVRVVDPFVYVVVKVCLGLSSHFVSFALTSGLRSRIAVVDCLASLAFSFSGCVCFEVSHVPILPLLYVDVTDIGSSEFIFKFVSENNILKCDMLFDRILYNLSYRLN